MEFRCFVHHGVLTAISQYNHYLFLPELQGQEAALAVRIHDYWHRELASRLARLPSPHDTLMPSLAFCALFPLTVPLGVFPQLHRRCGAVS